jgi:hypothetical protein
MKKIYLKGLYVVLMFMAFAVKANAAWDGSSADYTWYDGHSSPYSISSAEQMAGLQKIVAGQHGSADNFSGKTITLTADIDLGGYAWTPIGSSSYPFKGIFDGQGHTVSGLYINTSSTNSGLWGYTSDALLHDLKIDSPNVTGGTCVGALAGYFYISSSSGSLSYNPYIYNCSVTDGSVSGNGSGIGGLVGRIEDPISSTIYHDIQVYNCSTSCNVSETGSGQQQISGLIGNLRTVSGATVYNCYTTGNISASNGVIAAGGITGYADNGTNASGNAAAITIHDCFSTGNVNTGTTTGVCIGGLVGQLYEGGSGALSPSIYNCFTTGNVTGYQNVGGIIGTISVQTNNSSYITTLKYCYSTGQVTAGNGGGSGVGGILGNINGNNTSAKITVTKVAALNPSVTSSNGTNVRRVIGYIANCNTAPTLGSLYAFDNMSVGSVSTAAPISGSDATSQTGADISKTDVNTAANWSETWFSGASGWSFSNNNLAELTATYVNTQPSMPAHLQTLTAIGNAANDNVQISAGRGCIMIESNEAGQTTVYTLSGAKVAGAAFTNGKTVINGIAPALYVIKTDIAGKTFVTKAIVQ